jgi:hypothetical protein
MGSWIGEAETEGIWSGRSNPSVSAARCRLTHLHIVKMGRI